MGFFYILAHKKNKNKSINQFNLFSDKKQFKKKTYHSIKQTILIF
jgi:hypothetical protein